MIFYLEFSRFELMIIYFYNSFGYFVLVVVDSGDLRKECVMLLILFRLVVNVRCSVME